MRSWAMRMGEIRRTLEDLPRPDEGSAEAVRDRAARVLRPSGALAMLDEVAVWLAGWQRRPEPEVCSPAALVFAADHGVAAEGVSAYPSSVTRLMLRALREGVATACAMASACGARLDVVDCGVGAPTENLRVAPALRADRFTACFDLGRKAVADLDADLLVLGELGIGNTTAAAAICTALFGGPAGDWTGPGTGLDDAGVAHKTAVIADAVERVEGVDDPLEILRHLGGAELVALVGACVEARRRSLPVLLDGFAAVAALAPLERARPGALDHALAGHRSAEPGHRRLLGILGKEPLLDLGLRLGEGSGALAAVPLVRLAAACVTRVGTFDGWGADD